MKNKYEKLFCDFLSTTDFELAKYEDGFGLIDLQEANFGDIESDRFDSAREIFERMDMYITDYFLTDIEELLEERNIEVTWGHSCEEYLENAKHILPEYSFEFDVLDMICYHYNEINLNNLFEEKN